MSSTTLAERLSLPLNTTRILISLGLITPIFFQLSGQIFVDKATVFNAEGSLTATPLPISIISCLIGILLITDIRRAGIPILAVILSLVLLFISFFLSALLSKQSVQMTKLVLLAQFLIPTMGFILGYSWDNVRHSTDQRIRTFESVALILISFIIPIQIFATVLQKVHPLTPWMYFFSVYQHLQYVPVMLVGLFWWACIELFDRQWARRLSLGLMFFVSCYAMLAMSVQASVLCIVGAITLLCLRRLNRSTILGLCLSIGGLVMALQFDGGAFKLISRLENSQASEIRTMTWADKLGGAQNTLPPSVEQAESPKTPQQSSLPGLRQRLGFIELYLLKLTEQPKWLAFGAPYPEDRQISPSAHSYFIDLMFNFGLLGLMPIAALIGITLKSMLNHIHSVASSADGCALVVILLYLVVVHNSLTVALRQPYSGTLIFFLWGLLLARSHNKHTHI